MKGNEIGGRKFISILNNNTWKEYYDIAKMYNNEKDCSYSRFFVLILYLFLYD
jgi:hypothetical protein